MWFYWFYTITSINIPLFSDSMKSTYHMFHLHNICPYNQTIHYHFRGKSAPMCKSTYSLIVCNMILLILHHYLQKIYPYLVIPYNVLMRRFVYTILVPTIRLYTIIFEILPSSGRVNKLYWSSAIYICWFYTIISKIYTLVELFHTIYK